MPTEEVVEVRRGTKVNTERKFFPGYVLVKMDLTDETWHLVKNTPKVTGFLGGRAASRRRSRTPRPTRILRQVQEGDRAAEAVGHASRSARQVRVTDGPFASFNGSVEEVDEEKGRLKVSVSIFGRSTPVELEYRARWRSSSRSPAPVRRGARRGSGPPGPRQHREQEEGRMAKKITGYIKLQVPAGKANPSPPIGPALGQRGLNIMAFCKEFNAATQEMEPGMPMPVVITVFADRTFTFVTKTPPASYFLKKAAGIDKGARRPARPVRRQGDRRRRCREIAEQKMTDLNADRPRRRRRR